MLFACTRGKQQHELALMYNSQLSVIPNYRACLLESRDSWICLGVCVCVWQGLLMIGVYGLVCLESCVRERAVGLGGLVSPSVSIYTLGSHSEAEM